jgi:recombinational DNA repair protein (RecF pathway)
VNDGPAIDDQPLVAVEVGAEAMNVPHCTRCRAPLAPGVRYPKPGPFCDQCLEDMIASARSFGGPPGDVAERYNSKLSSFLQDDAIGPF